MNQTFSGCLVLIKTMNLFNEKLVRKCLQICQLFLFFIISSQKIPFTMNKSLNRLNRQFGLNIKNTISENDIESKLAIKQKPRKRVEIALEESLQSRPEMKYSQEILKYALTTITYPNILRGPQKVKRDIEALLYEVTSMNGKNCIWRQDFLTMDKPKDAHFINKEITLDKRASLIDWIIALHKKYTLRQETLHLTVKLIDEHCSKSDVPLKRYQLIGIAAFFMAAKFEEIELPKFKDYHRLISEHFTSEQMISAENQILCKQHFSLTRKVTSLWYLQAFGLKQITFGRKIKYSKKARYQDKQNEYILQSSSSQEEEPTEYRHQKFMSFCRYILNLVLIEFKISTKYKEDIIAISALIFGTFQTQFADADGKSLLKHFTQTKSRLVEQNQSPDEICRHIKKCMKKIESLYSKRHDRKYETINEKFNMVEAKK